LKGIAAKIEFQVNQVKVLRGLGLKNNLFVFINLQHKALDKSLLCKYCTERAYVVTHFRTPHKYIKKNTKKKIKKIEKKYICGTT
jgi:hypothetical protein